MINTVPSRKWDETPEVVASNLSWQVGHLAISIYYRSIIVIVGHKKDILEALAMREYTEVI